MRLKTIPGKLVDQDSEITLPYEKLAVIYNHVMRHVEYRRWAKYIKKILSKYGPSNPTIMDVGCGTGEFIYQLSQLGLAADGSDPSPAMLKIAKKRNPAHSFTLDGETAHRFVLGEWHAESAEIIHVTETGLNRETFSG